MYGLSSCVSTISRPSVQTFVIVQCLLNCWPMCYDLFKSQQRDSIDQETLMTSTDHPHFPHMLRPYNLKGLELRNRIAISGHFAGWWVGPKQLPSDAFVAYVEERVKGGVGLFTIGATNPEPGGTWMQNIDDDIIPRYKLLADTGHR